MLVPKIGITLMFSWSDHPIEKNGSDPDLCGECVVKLAREIAYALSVRPSLTP